MVASMKTKFYIGILLLALCFQSSNAQGIATIETNKTDYEYGEAIELSFTLENTGTSEFIIRSSSRCQAEFTFNDFDSGLHRICTADSVPVMFSPGSFRTWSWVIEPRRLGLPDTTGTHTISAYFGPYADTLQINAPEFIGGPLTVHINAGVSTDTLEAIKSELNAIVFESKMFGNGVTYEEWGIEGTSPEEAIEIYGTHPAFRFVDSNRFVQYASVVNTQKEVARMDDIKSIVYPNPFHATATLKIVGDSHQRVQVKIYDLLGRERMTLYDGYLTGITEFMIDGSTLSNGIYFYTIVGEHVNREGRFLHIE